jgi:hypothetical protein
MATTPKRSLKRTLAGTVEGRTPRFLLGSLALAMVISLLAGFAIGIKVEQHRVKTKKPKTGVVTPTTKPRKKATTGGKVPLNGTVVRVGPKSMVVSIGTRRTGFVLVKRTRLDQVVSATSADITVGSRVLVALEKPKAAAATTSSGATAATGAARTLTAKEVVVVSGTLKTRLGTTVTAVTANSFTFTLPSGKKATISTLGAKIEKTSGAAQSDFKAGRRVIVRTILSKLAPAKKKLTAKQRRLRKAARRQLIALEVVLLPVNNSFG